MVCKHTGKPMLDQYERTETRIFAPVVQSDLAPYQSPLGNYWVDGRSARREDLKRNGCREVDPTEYRPEYSRATFEARYARRRRF